MNAQATKLEAAENDLKQLMADVTRPIEKAQDAVARIASKAAAATIETESTSNASSCAHVCDRVREKHANAAASRARSLSYGGKAIRKISLMIDSAAPYVLHRRSKLRTKSTQTLPWQSNGRKTTEEGSDEQEF